MDKLVMELLRTCTGMLTIIAILCALAALFTVHAQAEEPGGVPRVTNLQATQRADGSGIVDIRYDIADEDSPRLWIGVAVSKNGGDWYGVTPTALSLKGDYGEDIAPGTGKHIEWDAPRDVPGAQGKDFRVALTATDWPSLKGGRDTVFGTFLYNRVHAGLPNFTDGNVFVMVDSRNSAACQMYRPIGPDGEPVVRSNEMAELWKKQPDGATREWWAHGLRQMVDIGYHFFLYSSFGTYDHGWDCEPCYENVDPNCESKQKYSPFRPDFAGKALGILFDEMGYPIKAAFFMDVPGAWRNHYWDRLREHYGEGKWCDYKWLDNGEDPDKIIGRMPINNENIETYFYNLMVKPFYDNFNRPQDRRHWQTHNDLPVEEGGRPVIWIYAGGRQWFTDFENTGPAFRHLKDLFIRDYGVEPHIAVSNYWFKNIKDLVKENTKEALAALNEVADAKQSYLGDWLWNTANPPDPNSWEFKDYRITRLSPGMKFPPERFRDVIREINGKRWRYVDGTEGADESYFLDREWKHGMGSEGFTRRPDMVVIGHWDEYMEGEMTGLMADYEAKGGGYLPPDYYMDLTRERIKAYGAKDPAHQIVAESNVFGLDISEKSGQD